MSQAPLRILHVDDDPEDLLLVADMLAEGGVPILHSPALDGREALELTQHAAYDAILLDYRLGPESGVDVLTELRANGVKSPVIILTGQDAGQVAPDVINVGAEAYLDKSALTAAMLVEAIESVVEGDVKKGLLTRRAVGAKHQIDTANNVLDNAPLGLVMFDSHLNVLYGNDAAQSLLGTRTQFLEALPTSVFEVQASQWWDGAKTLGDHPQLVDIGVAVLPEGERIVAVRPCPHRYRADQRLIEVRRQLVQRRADIAEVASIVAHDLRNHVRRMVAQAGEDLPSAMREPLEELDQMMAEMVEYARIGLNERVADELDLNEVLGAAIRILESTVPDFGSRITSDTLPTVMGDPLQLRELFVNLLQNMERHAGPEAKMVISHNEPHVLTISDTGPGLDEAQRAAVFRPFRIMDGENVVPGAGVGLAACRRILRAHGGLMDMNEDGAFVLRFPEQGKAVIDESREEP